MRRRHGAMKVGVADDDELRLHFPLSGGAVLAYPPSTYLTVYVHVCVCVCVQLARPARCPCAALNPAKAKPNYRRMATDLAGVLTITEEEAAGRGSHGRTRGSRERTAGGGGLYFRINEKKTYDRLHTALTLVVGNQHGHRCSQSTPGPAGATQNHRCPTGRRLSDAPCKRHAACFFLRFSGAVKS